jgi:predicted nucleic acid-binding protein
MSIPKVYLETTVFNFYFSTQSTQKRQDTRQFFDLIEKGILEPYSSDIVIDELRKDKTKFQEMASLIDQYEVEILPPTKEAEQLSEIYVAKEIIPAKYQTDALHIGIAAANNFDFVVSYNYGHIIKLKTINMTGLVNLQERYRFIGLITPTEVVEYYDK